MRKLCLDFDGALDREELEKRIDAVADMCQVDLRLHSVHPTARGFHCFVYAQSLRFDGSGTTPVGELTPMEVVALQLLLGSDSNREAFNFQRARVLGDVPAFWLNRWNVSYQEKL